MSATFAVVDRTTAHEFLFSRINYERTTQIPYQTGEFKLERMHQLLALLGNPHLALPAVHLAGTKGKGSTATMVAQILRSAGYKTGLYTSPHLERLEERFVVDGQLCSDDEFVRLAADVHAATVQLETTSPGRSPTFFEITTAMGMLHFARSGVELAVLEVGLGGRLDSTNVCRPLVSVITSISFDHTKQLGNTLAAIAREKAGIIKPGIPVVSGVVAAEPREVIAQVAHEVQAPLFQRGRDFDVRLVDGAKGESASVYYVQGQRELGPLTLGMLGQHQAANAATAIAAIAHLPRDRYSIGEPDIRQGLRDACCPARVQVFATRPTLVLDVAHNVASIAALLQTLNEQFAGRRKVLLFASSRDKDTPGMLQQLLPAFDHVVLTKYIHNPRAVEPAELLAMAQAIVSDTPLPVVCQTADHPTAAWQAAHAAAGPNDLIVIAGSFFLAAEVQSLLPPSGKSQGSLPD
jgi:dihydrofolate synthase/folylpolyglutamate synthase